jgi:hypothetical protein
MLGYVFSFSLIGSPARSVIAPSFFGFGVQPGGPNRPL